MDADGKRIEGVEATSAASEARIAAKIVVLAAGAVNSAALLLRLADAGSPTAPTWSGGIS